MIWSLVIPLMWFVGMQAEAAEVAGKSVSVTPVKVLETRVRQLAGEEDGFGDRSGLSLVVHVEGDEVEGASTYGHIKLTEAVDDAGTDLKLKERRGLLSRGRDGFTQIRSGVGSLFGTRSEKGFQVEIAMQPSARKATKLRSVKGEFQVLAGGRAATVSVKSLPGRLGKAIDDPQLKEAGVEVTVLDPKKAEKGFFGGGQNSLPVELKGKVTAVKSIEVLDSSGKSASQGHMTTGTEEKQSRTFELKKPLDDTMSLKIELLIGQKTVTVPMELKDIELP